MEVNMFFKSNFRPAFAAASSVGQANNGKLKNDAFTFNTAAETEDFGSFNSAGQNGKTNKSGKNGSKKSSFSLGDLNKNPIIIAAIAVVAVLVLAIIISAAFLFGSNGDISYTNNTYVSFVDVDGVYKVAANGKIVATYEYPVELVVADDRSFAYVIETGDDGVMIDVVKGDKLSDITTSPVTKVLATATLAPAVVWLDETNGVYHYTEKAKEERIIKDYGLTLADSNDHNFCISANGTTVAYTEFDEEKGNTYLYVFQNGEETKLQKNMYPIALSDNGSLIYAKASRDGVSQSLYVIPKDGDNEMYLIAEKFRSILDINVKGNEIVYTAWDAEAVVSTYLVAFNLKKMDQEITPTRLVKGAVLHPISVDGSVARFETFKDTYFQCDVNDDGYSLADSVSPVYYVNKKFEPSRISKYAGQFSPKGDYFYYINANNTLVQVDLKSDELTTDNISTDVDDFAITDKGNLYILSDDALRYRKVSAKNDKSTKVCQDVTAITMHRYSNTLYFSIEDAEAVYCSEEGGEKEQAKFDGITLTGLPQFMDTNAKKNFVGVYDESNEEWKLFYTSNGKKFKAVANCEDILQFSINSSILEDIIDALT